MLRAALPFILVFLGVFTAGCIAYVAWELSADDSGHPPEDGKDAESAQDP